MDDNIIDELEAEPIQTDSKPIEDLLQAIQDENFTQAERQFNDIIGDRLQDTLDQTKIKLADTIFNARQEVEDDEDFSEDDFDDDDFDDDDFS